MKICHMTSAHDTDNIRILKKECVSLAKNPKNEVFLVGPGENFSFKSVHIIGIGNSDSGRVKRIFKSSKCIYKKALELDADVYQFHDPELLLYAKKLKKHNKIVIFDSHEDYQKQIMEKDYIPKFVRRLIRRVYSIIENSACKYIDAVLFPGDRSPYEKRIKYCVPIFNTPIIDEFVQIGRQKVTDIKACCVGALTESRGIRVLMKACYKANVRLVLAGAFVPSEFEESLKKEKAYSIVDYRGICNREEVNEIYNECLIGTDTILAVGQYPYTENLSTKVYEYMLMKMPYITSNFKYNRAIIDQYHCGIYVDPSDEDAIANVLRYLIDNPEEAIQMGQNGRKAVEKLFNWEDDERRLFDLYELLYKESHLK